MADVEWVPAFEGQRPPFQPGHELSTTHGAYSPRRVAPVAAEIERAARTASSWPGYLDDASYASAVAAWARAEAIVQLLARWLDEQNLDDALSSTSSSTTDTEQLGEGRTRTRTSGRRTESVLSLLARWEATAARQRQRLGLDPLSRARLGKDVTQAAANVDLASYLSDLREQQEAAPHPVIAQDARTGSPASDGMGTGQ